MYLIQSICIVEWNEKRQILAMVFSVGLPFGEVEIYAVTPFRLLSIRFSIKIKSIYTLNSLCLSNYQLQRNYSEKNRN